MFNVPFEVEVSLNSFLSSYRNGSLVGLRDAMDLVRNRRESNPCLAVRTLFTTFSELSRLFKG